jgi:hypothetical protein
VSIPKSKFTRRIEKFQGADSIVVSGTDFYGLLDGTNTITGSNLFSLPLNPLAIPGTRLAIEALLWQKFRFEHIEICYVPAVGTSNDGTILFSHVSDPEVRLPQPATNAYVEALLCVPGAKMTQIWKPVTHTWSPSKTDKREFYVAPDDDNEERFTMQAIMKVIGVTVFNKSGIGTLFLRYRVRFYERIMSISDIAQATTKSVKTTSSSGLVNGIQLIDTGWTGQINLAADITVNVGLNINTTYKVYFNFNLGGLQAFKPYFIRWTANNTATALRTIGYDAQNNSGEVVSGSFYGSGYIPPNATAWFTNAPDDPLTRPKTKAQEMEERINKLTDMVEDLSVTLDAVRYASTTPSTVRTRP